MLDIGRYNSLPVKTHTGLQLYLDGGDSGDILLTDKHPPKNSAVGDTLEVFIYTGSEGELFATCKKPFVEMEGVAWLKVISISKAGAFLDWGIAKDLLVPFSEQDYELEVGDYCLAKVFMDEQQRITASTELNNFILDQVNYLKKGDKVSLIIAKKTDLGFKAIINDTFWGVLYYNEVFQPLKEGQRLTGYIQKVREDKKVDLALHQAGHTHVTPVTEQIMQRLQENDGIVSLSDKSTPEEINNAFGVSKKVFKHALGQLYKQRLISITKTHISLNK